MKGIISDRGGEVALSLESDAVVLMKDCCVLSVVCVCVVSTELMLVPGSIDQS